MTRQQQLAQVAQREAEFVRQVADGADVADAAASSGLTAHQANEYLRNPTVAQRVREQAIARFETLLLPQAVNALLRLMDPANDTDHKRAAAQARAAATLVLGAMRQDKQVGRPKIQQTGPKTFEEMTPSELEDHLASLRLTQGEAKTVE
jgi:hypothetical protein